MTPHSSTFPAPCALVHIVLGVVLAGLALVGVVYHPAFRGLLGALLALYAVGLALHPRLWLIVLPAVLPVIDFTPWTGRIYFNEFDYFILVTLAVLYLRAGEKRMTPPLIRGNGALYSLMALSFALSALIWFLPFEPPSITSFASYKSPYNALRVAKGFFWAWLLLPALEDAWRRNGTTAARYLMAGMALGLVGCGVSILWEEGTLAALVDWQGIYHLANVILDFSTSYRATGLFSGMHTGGTALDGYLALAIPTAMALLVHDRDPRLRALGGIAMLAGLYAAIMTFSRGLYGAIVLAFACFAMLYVYQHRLTMAKFKGRSLGALVAVIVFSGLFFAGYAAGGSQVLLLGIAWGAFTTFFTVRRAGRPLAPTLAVLALVGLIIGYGIADGITDSRWSTLPDTQAPLVAGLLTLALGGLAFACGWLGAPVLGGRNAGALALILTALWGIGIPASRGYRITERFSSATPDLAFRETHWGDVLGAMDHTMRAHLVGMGVGSFPGLFFLARFGQDSLVNYGIRREPASERAFLAFGAGDYNITQKAPIKPYKTYRLHLSARSQSGGVISVKLCEKHILFSERYIPNCTHVTFKVIPGPDWSAFEGVLQSGRLGVLARAWWPVTLMLHVSENHPGIVEMTDIRLFDEQGKNIIENGNFSAGMDHWYMIRDFSHVEWHEKNLLLHIFFEQGLLGVTAFALWLVVAAWRQGRLLKNSPPLAYATLTAFVAFLAVGLFGSILDNPPVAFLFFILAAAALQKSPKAACQSPDRARVSQN